VASSRRSIDFHKRDHYDCDVEQGLAHHSARLKRRMVALVLPSAWAAIKIFTTIRPDAPPADYPPDVWPLWYALMPSCIPAPSGCSFWWA
jgi:hypothetical protein